TALAERTPLLAEAGTGTGKTLAYLIPALASGGRVVVATATKALQAQLVENDAPLAAEVLGRELSVAMLKGRENYVCRRLEAGFDGLGEHSLSLFGDADLSELDRLRSWARETASGDRSELEFEPRPSAWAEIAVGGERCLGSRCSYVSSCYAELAREAAEDAELVVTNHALLLADVVVRSASDDARVLPEHDVLVVDEAHRLEDAAATWLGGQFSMRAVRRLGRDIERTHLEQGRAAPGSLLDRVETEAERLLATLAPREGRHRLGEREIDQGGEQGARVSELLDQLGNALHGISEELDGLSRRAFSMAEDVEACLAQDEVGTVAWAEPGQLQWARVDVGKALHETLWEEGPTPVLVSATLDQPLVGARLGFGRAATLTVPSPFDYSSQALVYLPEEIPEPSAAGYARRLCDEVAGLCRASRGRALVLTTSYRMLELIAEHLRGALPYRVIAKGSAPRERLLEQFRAELDTVLVATQTFWEGIDVPGDALSLVVIEKLPFQVPDDPLVAARCERIRLEGGDPFADYQVPTAVLALRQGFGRLIRSRTDRGVVALLDGRLRTRPYARHFLEALPPAPIVSSLAAVETFFADAPGGS
ncbi:MAG: ATP-dependent DNA helicase, partial [Gaiellaceae bacterium]